jgi:hypothetical protein
MAKAPKRDSIIADARNHYAVGNDDIEIDDRPREGTWVPAWLFVPFDGCYHYDYQLHCTQCDPAAYGPCRQPCRYKHVCCTCPEGCPLHETESED